jgi:hypothetical protein
MFSREDLKIDSTQEFIEFLPIFIFIGLVAPFLLAAYTVGFFLDKAGLLQGNS